jgi:hypothetical protein
MNEQPRRDWRLNYVVTADFLPFRKWKVRAEGECEARLIVSNQIHIDPVELEASLDHEPQTH